MMTHADNDDGNSDLQEDDFAEASENLQEGAENDDDGSEGDSGSELGDDESSLEDDLVNLYLQQYLTIKTMEKVVKLLSKHFPVRLRGFRSMLAQRKKDLPPPSLMYSVEDLAKKKSIPITGHHIKREHYQSSDKFAMEFALWKVHVKDVVAMHEHQHSERPRTATLSWDGVPMDHSSGRSLDVIAIEFPNCKMIHPLRIFESYGGFGHNELRSLEELRQEMQEANLQLDKVCADLPKRASLLGIKHHGGYHACSHCLIPGVPVGSGRKRTVHYPLRPAWPARTRAHYLEAVTNPEFKVLCERDEKEQDELLGVRANSPLLRFPNFDPVNGVPIDAMHNLHLGLVRRMLTRTFKFGTSTARKRKGFPRFLQSTAALNRMYRKARVFSEHSRKPRPLSLHWKASELKGLLLYHFPVLLSTLLQHPDGLRNVLRDVWCLLAYLSHVFVRQPGEDVLTLSVADAMEEFCDAFDNYMGVGEATLNAHLFSHYLTVHQELGSICGYTTYSSEDWYQCIKRSYTPGTASVGKQILEKMQLRNAQHLHRCNRNLKFTTKETTRSQDNFVYCRGYNIFRVTSVPEGQTDEFYAVKVYAQPYEFVLQSGRSLYFHELGIFKGPAHESNVRQRINVAQVLGKVIVTPTYLICCPRQLILEKSY